MERNKDVFSGKGLLSLIWQFVDMLKIVYKEQKDFFVCRKNLSFGCINGF